MPLWISPSHSSTGLTFTQCLFISVCGNTRSNFRARLAPRAHTHTHWTISTDTSLSSNSAICLWDPVMYYYDKYCFTGPLLWNTNDTHTPTQALSHALTWLIYSSIKSSTALIINILTLKASFITPTTQGNHSLWSRVIVSISSRANRLSAGCQTTANLLRAVRSCHTCLPPSYAMDLIQQGRAELVQSFLWGWDSHRVSAKYLTDGFTPSPLDQFTHQAIRSLDSLLDGENPLHTADIMYKGCSHIPRQNKILNKNVI